MRKATLPLVMVLAAGITGMAAAGLHMKPSVAIVIGILFVVGGIAAYGVNTDKLTMFAVGLFVFTITWNGVRVGHGNAAGGSGGAFGDVMFAFAFVTVMADVIRRRRPVPVPPWLMLTGAGLLVAFLLVMIFPPSSKLMQQLQMEQGTIVQEGGGVPGQVGSLGLGANGVAVGEFLLGIVLIPIILVTAATTVKRCQRLFDLFVAGAAVNGMVGVLGLAGIRIASSAASGSRSAGLTIHPNYLALTCVIALPLAMLWFGRSRRFNIAGTFAVGSLLGGIYASGSRAGFPAAIFAVVVAVLLVPRLRRGLPYVLPVAGIVLVSILLFTSIGHKILVQLRLASASSGTPNVGAAGSNYQRSFLAHTAWSQVQVRPLVGVGFSQITAAHDIYLELLDSGGAVAMAAFLAFIGGMVASLRRAWSGPLRDEALVCVIAIIAWLANGVFDNQVADKYLYMVPGLLLAIGRTTWLLQTRTAPEVLPATPRIAPMPARALVGVGTR
jgi:hypothetical protein